MNRRNFLIGFHFWVRHTLPFFRNAFNVLQSGRKHFGSTNEPFTITVAGQKLYVLSSAASVEELFKKTEGLSWEFFVQELYKWTGFSDKAMNRLWQMPTEQQTAENPARTSYPNEMIQAYQRRQLRPGPHMEILAKSINQIIDDSLQWESLISGQSPSSLKTDGSLSFSIIEWTNYVFISTTTEAYWGKSILKVGPEVVPAFITWEKTNWKYIFQLPRFLARDMYSARDTLIDAFTAYFRIPREERADAAWFVPTAEDEFRDIGLQEYDIGRAHMLQHWAINSNMQKVSFWLLAHLLNKPTLLQTIKDETAGGLTNDTPDIAHLTNHCPRLEALFHEVLRFYVSNSLMRHVTAPTQISGKTLLPGREVMVPYRVLHFDEQVWGPDAGSFKPERFLDRKDLAHDHSYKPFGGGEHLCPGRFVAKQAIFLFVTIVLHRFELELDGMQGKSVPRADIGKPSLGTLGPRDGDDVRVRIRPRGKA